MVVERNMVRPKEIDWSGFRLFLSYLLDNNHNMRLSEVVESIAGEFDCSYTSAHNYLRRYMIRSNMKAVWTGDARYKILVCY